jgi:hypothetical protein
MVSCGIKSNYDSNSFINSLKKNLFHYICLIQQKPNISMNLRIKILIPLIGILLFSACQKEPEPKPLPEEGYPYIYKRLSSSEWETRNAVFQEINIHEGLNLNDCGFAEGEILLNKNDSLTEEFVIQTLESIIERYKSFLGIPNTTSIDYRKDFRIYDLST